MSIKLNNFAIQGHYLKLPNADNKIRIHNSRLYRIFHSTVSFEVNGQKVYLNKRDCEKVIHAKKGFAKAIDGGRLQAVVLGIKAKKVSAPKLKIFEIANKFQEFDKRV